jgi:signal transduction histidine kinase/ligand-binding sensor domain-containing protein
MRPSVLGQIESKCLPQRSWRWLAASLLGCLAGSLFPGVGWAQYRFDNWTTENGLPQNSVLAIAQTQDGYLWLATYNGLARFDGVRFTVFDKHNTSAFKTSRFQDLFADATGALWLSVEEGGAIRYQSGVFTPFTTAQGLPSDMVRNVQSSPDGALLIVTDKGAVWLRNGQFAPYAEDATAEDLRVYLGPSGTHWVMDKTGLRHSRQANGAYSYYDLPAEMPHLPNTKRFEDRHGALWIAPPRYGIFKIKDGVATDYTQRLKLSKPATIVKILEDVDGSLWFATLNAGLIHFSNNAAETVTVYTTADGLSSNAMRGLLRDREGTLWIGTDGGGLNRMTRRFISGYSEAQGLAGNVAHAVSADRAGNIWVATHNGLSKLSAGAITNYQYATTAGRLPLRGLQALHEDRSGRLWVGGYDGLCSFKDGVFSPALLQHNGLALNVWAMCEDRHGVLWLGTHFGLVRFKDGVGGHTYTTKDGLPKDTIRALHEDRHGALWLGTEGGLVKFQDGRFTVFTTKDGLVNERVWSIYEDTEGVLWLGTFDGGLSRFKNGRFTNYTTAEGLYDNGVFQILEDSSGHLWMSCYRGLYRVSKQQLNAFADGKISTITSTAFGKADGMLSSDCNGGRQPSGVKTRDGQLWFTTLKGVAVVSPDEMTANPLPPPLLIEGALLDRARAEIQGGLRVRPGQNNLALNYTALSFLKSEQIRFKYQLLGQDPDWIEAGAQRTANYSYLRPGQYTFKVIAANSDGVWNNTGAQLQVVVLPAFYQTWWFRLLALLAVAGSIGLAFKRRLDQAHRARRAQEEFSRRLIESQEQERKRIAAELHDSLGQNLLVIKNYALMGLSAANGENPTREHLNEISDSATLAIEEVRQIAHNLRPYQLERLGLTNTLQIMLRQIANASDIGFTVEVDALDGLLSQEEEISLYRIVQEGVNNILKHSGASEASVRIKLAGDEIQMTIADDGRGFRLEAAGQAELQKRGLGLTGSAERVRMLGGSQMIQTAPGQGTTIHITIPTNKHASNQ